MQVQLAKETLRHKLWICYLISSFAWLGSVILLAGYWQIFDAALNHWIFSANYNQYGEGGFELCGLLYSIGAVAWIFFKFYEEITK